MKLTILTLIYLLLKCPRRMIMCFNPKVLVMLRRKTKNLKIH